MVASELALALASRGHEIHVISYARPFRLGEFRENVLVHEVDIASYPLFQYPPYALALATKMVEVARNHQLDLIHSHYAVPHAASAYLARAILGDAGLKTVTTLHGTDITLVGLDSSFYEVVRFAIEQSDAVTAVSRYLKERTISEFAVRRPIHVVYNFVDTERYLPQSDHCVREYFAPQGEKLLIHASNFRPVKRVGDAVRVLARIREEIPARLLLVGDGPERLFVQQLVKELKLTDHVVFLGQQDYLERILPCTDVLILPSEQESFGLVALEAHACGVPVVAARVGGVPEVVEDGMTGFLVPVGEIGEMAAQVLRLLADDQLHREFSRRARERAERNFRTDLIVPEYERIYREVVEGS
ncbi:MAG: N-acetyl-alpha-D-glucosaminyl L-malate synthase BshA [Acidobacteriota bacterium]